jgi:hypothetical protein
MPNRRLQLTAGNAHGLALLFGERTTPFNGHF